GSAYNDLGRLNRKLLHAGGLINHNRRSDVETRVHRRVALAAGRLVQGNVIGRRRLQTGGRTGPISVSTDLERSTQRERRRRRRRERRACLAGPAEGDARGAGREGLSVSRI